MNLKPLIKLSKLYTLFYLTVPMANTDKTESSFLRALSKYVQWSKKEIKANPFSRTCTVSMKNKSKAIPTLPLIRYIIIFLLYKMPIQLPKVSTVQES